MALSDEQLRDRLTNLGCDVGPIDDTTRPLYVSLLNRRENEAKSHARGTSVKPPHEVSSNSQKSKGRSSNRGNKDRSAAFSDEESEHIAPPKRTTSPRKSSQTTNRRKRDSSPITRGTNSTMYSPSSTTEGRNLFSSGISPVRPEPPSPPSEPENYTVNRNKYVRRPLHPPNYNYFASSNGFSDDEADYRVSRPSSSRNNGVPYGNVVTQAPYKMIRDASSATRSRRRSPTISSAPSHIISKFLVVVTALLFCGLAFSYYRLGSQIEFNDLNEEQAAPFEHSICTDDSKDQHGHTCIRKEVLNDSLEAARKIHAILDDKYYQKSCGDGDPQLTDEGISYENITKLTNTPEDVFQGTLYLIQENKDWGMSKRTASISSSLYLAAYTPPWTCRLKQAVMQMIMQLVLLVAVVITCALAYCLIQKRKENLQERKRWINGYVEDITEMLTNNASDNPETPYLSILEIRNKLIPSASKSGKGQQLWKEVEEKFEATESTRVAREKQRIRGEWFVVWRWLPPPSTNGSGEKVWQGKACDGTSSCQPLTNCLKIKNMFNRVEEQGDDWAEGVKRAILNKCGPSHGILHMHVAQDSPEGLVYAKMDSLEAAGDAYKKLHGSWFAGRLVTAKYLREERYHEKFPDSLAITTPMTA